MSEKYIGGIITANPTAPTTSSASGIWTPEQVDLYVKLGTWPRSPGAPTIGTATVSGITASVAFTAPTDLGTGSISYTATSSPGGITGTGSSSPISVGGLSGGTSYTFTVKGTTPGGTGPASAASNSVTTATLGSQTYASPGTYTWVAPSCVTSVSVVAVGSGETPAPQNCGNHGGRGGSLSYLNNYSVTSGNSYPIKIGATGSPSGQGSYFNNTTTLYAKGGNCTATANAGTASYSGGIGSNNTNTTRGQGGGGAAGYAGNGGVGGCIGGGAGSGGGAAGGANASSSGLGGSAGGGVGLFGQGSSGSGGGNGGSGGGQGGTPVSGQSGGIGGQYGGGGGGYGSCGGGPGGAGGTGAVRIVWPGNIRTFPSTCVGAP